MTSASDSRVLWGAGTSRTVRPRWALRELGLDYRSEPVVPRTESMHSKPFRAVSERGKVPILEDDGFVVGESAAIVFYLADRYDSEGKVLSVPVDDFEKRSAYYDLSFFILTELDATSLYIVRRHEGLPQIYGEAPTAVKGARQYFSHQLGEMERRLTDGRPYLLGDTFLAPDLLLMTCLDWANAIGIELPKTLSQYRLRIATRPAYGEAMGENFAPLRELAG